MNITSKVLQKKQEDRKQYYRSVQEMYDIIGNQKKDLFIHLDSTGVERELGLILRYFGIPMVTIPNDLEEEKKFDYVLSRVNVMNRSVTLRQNWWKQDGMPLLCTSRQDGKTYALIPGKYGGLYYYDTQKEKKIRVTAAVAEKFEMEAVCLYRPLPGESMSAKDLFFYLMRSLPAANYLFLCIATAMVVLLGLILPEVNQYIFQFVIPSGEKGDIPYVIVLLLGVVISTSLFGLLRSIWVARIEDQIHNIAETGLWNRILNLPPRFFKQYDAGELTSRAMMLGQICDVMAGSVFPVILTTVFSLVYFIQVTSFSVSLLLPTAVILGGMLLVSMTNSFFTIRMNRKKNKVNTVLSGFVYQLFQAIGTLKVNGAEVRAFAKWADMYGQKMNVLPNFFVKFTDSINVLITIGGSMMIYRTVFEQGISASDYISFQVAFGLLTGALAQFAGIVTQMAYVRPALQMIMPFLEQKPEKSSECIRIEQLKGKIDISNVSFRYSPDMEDVLHNLNLSIQPGEYVALVGPSGCGKSTVFRLLLGFEHPDRGAVFYDDRELEELDKQSVRKRIGTVLQDGNLFNGDIFSNIAICNPEMTLDDAWDVARQAGLAEDIENMPMGMFTMVGDGDGGISGGQKQRILIARALAMKPDIILFDEATSALDNITQKKVVEALEQRHITRIVIAHRLSTIQNCDRIIYLEHGAVAEEGTYEALMKKKGKFYELAKWQLA